MKKIGIFISSILGIICIITIVLVVKSIYKRPSSGSEALKPYEDRLEELNSELGANMVIYISESDPNYEENIQFYTSITMEEFDNYIRDLYDKTKEYDETNNLSDVPYKNITKEEFEKIKQDFSNNSKGFEVIDKSNTNADKE